MQNPQNLIWIDLETPAWTSGIPASTANPA